MTGLPQILSQELKTVLDSIGDIVVITDARGEIVYANAACLRASGYAMDELIGRRPAIFKSGKAPAEVYQQMWSTLRSGVAWQGEFLNKRKNGSHYLVRARICGIGGQGADFTHYLAIEEDITEKERIRSVAEKQANLLTELSHRVPGLIFQMQLRKGMRLSVPYASSALETVFGFTLAELADDALLILERVHPADRRLIRQSLLRSARLLREWIVEFRVVVPGRELRWYQVNARPDKIDAQTLFWNGYVSDVTERKISEFELRRHAEFMRKQNQILAHARHEAGQAVRAKSQFLANMSHEIRTPMNGVLGAADLLLETRLDDEQREYVDIVRSGGMALMHVINSILEYSKLEADKLVLKTDEFSFSELLQEVKSLLLPSIREGDLRIRIEDHNDAHLLVAGDVNLLRRVLLNLGGNAIKFTPCGEVCFCLRIIKRDADNVLYRCEVRDTGIGISPEHQKMIFEPFTQVDSSNTRHYGGSGLGLAICHQLVESLHGEIGVNSSLGNGSVFWFEVTFKAVHAQQVNGQSVAVGNQKVAAPVAAEARAAFARHKVLVADDDPVNLRVIELHLLRRGLEVFKAMNGEEVLRMLPDCKPVLILMDCQMPLVDGFEAAQRIRAGACGTTFVDTPIVAITALALGGDAQRCLDAGMNDYISKPVRQNELDSALKRWIVLA